MKTLLAYKISDILKKVYPARSLRLRDKGSHLIVTIVPEGKRGKYKA